MQLPPLLCFNGIYVQEKVLNLLNSHSCNERPRVISQSTIQRIRIGSTTCYETVIRVPGARMGFLQEIAILAEIFKGPILVFDKDIQEVHLRDAHLEQLNNLYIINNIELIEALLCVPLGPECRESLRKLLLENYKPLRLPTPMAPSQNEMAYADRFVEAMQEGRHIEPPEPGMFPVSMSMFLHNPTVLMTPHNVTVIEGEDGEDEEFLRAQEASLRGEDENPPPPRRPRKLNPEWESVLKEPEIAQPGDPACVVCHMYRASILFIDCSHQCMCDKCVRDMFEMHGVQRACPICREPCDRLNRPYLPEKAK